MIDPTFKLTYDGGPIGKLNELIEQRKNWLHEGYRDAIVATAITALTSIRKATKNFRGEIESGFIYSMTRRDDVHPSFVGRKRCFRYGRFPRKGASRVDLGSHCVQLVPPGDGLWRQASCWRVEINKERQKRWTKQPATFFVIAMSEYTVRTYLERRFGRIAKRQAGLARTVLGVAMAKISTRPPANEQAGAHVKKIADKFAVAVRRDSGDNLSLHIESNIEYAVLAVEGRQTGIDNALKSAANRIAGMINHKANMPLGTKLATPFPEVKRK